MRVESTSRSRAFSPVISAVIISVVVIAVGGAVWAFSQGAMTITAEDYTEAMINMTETISERFIIEHVANTTTQIHVWIYNYGEISIVVDVHVDIDGGESNFEMGVEVEPRELRKVVIDLEILDYDEVAVKAVSRRGNNAYYRYLAQ